MSFRILEFVLKGYVESRNVLGLFRFGGVFVRVFFLGIFRVSKSFFI